MAFIETALLSAELTNWVGKLLLLLFDWIGNFGWTVVVFSIFLKIALSPLDVWQRLSMRKQQKKTAELKPKMEKLERQYRNNPDMLKQKQYELQRSASINMLASCIPMIVTMIVFFVVFAGFRALIVYENQLIVEKVNADYVQYVEDYDVATYSNEDPNVLIEKILERYPTIYSEAELNDIAAKDGSAGLAKLYKTRYNELMSIDEQKVKVTEMLENSYDSHIESWLWIKNVFMSDIGTNVVPTVDNFTSAGAGGINAEVPDGLTLTYEQLTGPAAAKYNKTSFWDVKNWNGYFILPLLSLLTSFLSTFLMQKSQPQQAMGTKEQQAQQQKTAKLMTYMMPIMLAVFAIMYSAAFAIYYFMSNLLSTLFSLIFTAVTKRMDKKENDNKAEKVIISRSK